MACPCRLNAASTITLAPPAKKTAHFKKVLPTRVRDCCGKLPDGYWKRIKRNPRTVTSTISGFGGWYASGEFRTDPQRVCLYEKASTFSLTNSESIFTLSLVETSTVPDTPCNQNEYLIYDGTEFLLVTPSDTTSISVDGFTTADVIDIVPLARKDADEYLVVKSSGIVIWATLNGTTLTQNQELDTGISSTVSLAVSFRCLDACTQRYTVLVVDENNDTTAFALWRVNNKLSIADDSETTGTLTLGNGEVVLTTDQVRLETVGAITHGGITRLFRYEPTKTNLYATVYYRLNLSDTIAHLGSCDGVVDIILENSEWIRIQDGIAYHFTI